MPGFRRTRSAHFTQPDNIVPGAGDALAWDRYAYVNYNPIKYLDPSGHFAFSPPGSNVRMTDGGNNSSNELLPDGSVLENNDQRKNDLINGYLSAAGFFVDIVGMGVSFVGIFVEMGFAITGELVTPAPGDEAIGGYLGYRVYASSFDKVENALGYLGLGIELCQGFYNGENYVDFTSGELYLGGDSTAELMFATAGQVSNEATVDFVLNVLSFGYDLSSSGDYWHSPISLLIDVSGFSILYDGHPIFNRK